jgi:hypothetical protein
LGPEGGKLGRPVQAVNSIIMSGIAPNQNAFKYKITPHKHKSIVFGRKMGPLDNGAMCSSTAKHNGKSGTVGRYSNFI